MKLTWIKLIILSFLYFWINGCGGDTGGTYTAQVNFTDADEEIMTLDLVQDVCGTYKAGEQPKYELFTDTLANITITVAEGMPGLTIRGYSISYIPLQSATGLGNMVAPPTTNALTNQGNNNIHIPTNSSSTFTITCFSTDQKEELVSLLGWTWREVAYIKLGDPDPDGDPLTDDAEDDEITYDIIWSSAAAGIYSGLEVCRYTIRIILHCEDDSGYDRDIEVSRTLYLGNYDNC
ncbi:MAG: hypothetical protein WC799_12990 [Desulfobacteraceae bacterium]|jgi:hypothetical protein